jgi:hypothetical protein
MRVFLLLACLMGLAGCEAVAIASNVVPAISHAVAGKRGR